MKVETTRASGRINPVSELIISGEGKLKVDIESSPNPGICEEWMAVPMPYCSRNAGIQAVTNVWHFYATLSTRVLNL